MRQDEVKTNSLLASRVETIGKRMEQLALISEMEIGIYRPFASASAKKARQVVEEWCLLSHLNCAVDGIGNLIVTTTSHSADKKTFYVGSHIDTVINAGKYDGILGFLLALDLLEFGAEGLPFNVAAVAFADEEGVRYSTAYLGSHVFAGTFNQQLLERLDDEGISMREAIRPFGEGALEHSAICPKDFEGYLEVHIEQGPVLESGNSPLGIVNTIAGQKRALIAFEGKAGHAGTVPMTMRQDAVLGAAAFALEVERCASIRKEQLVATTGKWRVGPNATNVIADYAQVSLDVRSGNAQLLDEAYTELKAAAAHIAKHRKLKLTWELTQTNEPTVMDESLKERLHSALVAIDVPVRYLDSGAGHDAVVVAGLGPVAMLFVRSKDGLSHHPDEFTSAEDIAKAIEATGQFFLTFRSQ